MDDPFTIVDRIISNLSPTPGFTTVSSVLGVVLNILLGSSLSISLIAIIYSGIKFVMSEGDIKAIDTARKYLTVAVVAFILTISAFVIKIIILNTLGGSTADITNELPGF